MKKKKNSNVSYIMNTKNSKLIIQVNYINGDGKILFSYCDDNILLLFLRRINLEFCYKFNIHKSNKGKPVENVSFQQANYLLIYKKCSILKVLTLNVIDF